MTQTRLFVAVCALTMGMGGAKLSIASDSGGESPANLGDTMPAGYRDWTLISVAHEEGKLNDIRAILGNKLAVDAYRRGDLPFPDGAVIARLAWRYVPSDENNKAFGRTQSYVAGEATNVQFMVKDSKRFASTEGWGFVQFNDGKPAHMDAKVCFACHVPVKGRDFVFTRYSP